MKRYIAITFISAVFFVSFITDNSLMADNLTDTSFLENTVLTDATETKAVTERRKANRKRRPRRTDEQVFFLNFETVGSPTFSVFIFSEDAFFNDEDFEVFGVFPDYVFTLEDRQAIQKRLEADFKGFDIAFTQQKPTSGDFSTIFFSNNDDANITIDLETGFSFSSGFFPDMDFLNQDRNDSAIIDITGIQFEALMDPTGTSFATYLGAPLTTSLEEALSEAIVNSASNSAARDILILMGGEPHDSFGPPGQGIPDFITREAFSPTYTGLQNATETSMHLADAVTDDPAVFGNDLFLSERSSLRLQLAQRIFNGRFDVTEESRSTPNEIQDIRLRSLPVPNTIVKGQNKNAALKGKAAVVSASIDEFDEKDRYRFRANAGDVITIETSPELDPEFDVSVIATLSLNLVNPDGSFTEIASNAAALDGLDAFILDAPIPSTGTYVLEVEAPDTFISFGFGPDANSFGFEAFSLEEEDLLELRTGNYNLVLYVIDAIK